MRKYILIPVLVYFLVLALMHYYENRPKNSNKPSVPQKHVRAYIDLYKEIAVAEMQYSGIPASITLAQGMLESNYGRSELARQANNHFGIKCKKGWGYNRYNIYSDEWNKKRKRMEPRMSCFRVYPSAASSYRDHSTFLKKGDRYAFLFQLSKTDYKGWAKGLQKAGYATDPDYARKLISIIRRNRLYELDV